MHARRYVPCRSTHRISVAVTLNGVYRHLRCKFLDRNCTCLTSLGLDHVKWNMGQLRAVRSRFTTWPHDFVLCGARYYLNVVDTTENFFYPEDGSGIGFRNVVFTQNMRQWELFLSFNFFFSPFLLFLFFIAFAYVLRSEFFS